MCAAGTRASTQCSLMRLCEEAVVRRRRARCRHLLRRERAAPGICAYRPYPDTVYRDCMSMRHVHLWSRARPKCVREGGGASGAEETRCSTSICGADDAGGRSCRLQRRARPLPCRVASCGEHSYDVCGRRGARRGAHLVSFPVAPVFITPCMINQESYTKPTHTACTVTTGTLAGAHGVTGSSRRRPQRR